MANELKSPIEEQEDRYVFFALGEQSYATPLLSTREVVEPSPTKPVPNMKDYFLGMSNIRGEVVGVIDLAKLMGVSRGVDENKQAIIIFEGTAGTYGVLVDEIHGVKNVDVKDIEENTHVKFSIRQDYIKGIAKVDSDLIAILDLGRVLEEEDLVLIKRSQAV